MGQQEIISTFLPLSLLVIIHFSLLRPFLCGKYTRNFLKQIREDRNILCYWRVKEKCSPLSLFKEHQRTSVRHPNSPTMGLSCFLFCSYDLYAQKGSYIGALVP